MKYKIFVIIYALSIYGCASFNGGQFYDSFQSQLASDSYTLYPNGKYEDYFSAEGSKGLLEKGSWSYRNGKVIIIVDTLFDLINKKANKAGYKRVFKNRISTRNELILKKRINGIVYTQILIKIHK